MCLVKVDADGVINPRKFGRIIQIAKLIQNNSKIIELVQNNSK